MLNIMARARRARDKMPRGAGARACDRDADHADHDIKEGRRADRGRGEKRSAWGMRWGVAVVGITCETMCAGVRKRGCKEEGARCGRKRCVSGADAGGWTQAVA